MHFLLLSGDCRTCWGTYEKWSYISLMTRNMQWNRVQLHHPTDLCIINNGIGACYLNNLVLTTGGKAARGMVTHRSSSSNFAIGSHVYEQWEKWCKRKDFDADEYRQGLFMELYIGAEVAWGRNRVRRRRTVPICRGCYESRFTKTFRLEASDGTRKERKFSSPSPLHAWYHIYIWWQKDWQCYDRCYGQHIMFRWSAKGCTESSLHFTCA